MGDYSRHIPSLPTFFLNFSRHRKIILNPSLSDLARWSNYPFAFSLFFYFSLILLLLVYSRFHHTFLWTLLLNCFHLLSSSFLGFPVVIYLMWFYLSLLCQFSLTFDFFFCSFPTMIHNASSSNRYYHHFSRLYYLHKKTNTFQTFACPIIFGFHLFFFLILLDPLIDIDQILLGFPCCLAQIVALPFNAILWSSWIAKAVPVEGLLLLPMIFSTW